MEGKGWKRRVLLKRSCTTANPFRCKDLNYQSIASPNRNETEKKVQWKQVYEGKCIDESQICDSKVDCIYGEDEGPSCPKIGRNLQYLKNQ